MIGAQAQEFGMDQKYNNHEPDYGMDKAMVINKLMEKTTAMINTKIVMVSVSKKSNVKISI